MVWARTTLPYLLVVSVLVAVGAFVSPAMATADPFSAVTMFSDRGDYIGGGQQRLFDSSNGTVGVSGNIGYLTVHVSGGSNGDSFDMDFAAPPGQGLAPGVYDGAQRAAFRQSGRPGIDIGGDGRGCNEDAGRFEVKDIATDVNGGITRLWIVYEQHCEGAVPALFGEVRFNEPPPPGPVIPAPLIARWPAQDFGQAGTPLPVTMIAAGATSIRSASVQGNSPNDFPIRIDGCTGQTLASGGQCPVWVAFTPTAPGTRLATLRITDSGGGVHDVALQGFAYSGTTKLVMHSDPGDFVGRGQDWSYTPANATITIAGSPQHVEFRVDGTDGAWWVGDFEAPQGNLLGAGDTYDGASTYPPSGPGPTMNVYGSGGSCSTLQGSFTITNATYNADNTPRSFGVTFEQRCSGATGALHGTFELRVGDTTAPAPWMANGGAYPGNAPPQGSSAAPATSVATDAGMSTPAGPGGTGLAQATCTAPRSLLIRVHRPAGYSLRRVEFYIGRRRVAAVRGRRVSRAVHVAVPGGPFRLVLLLHVTRGARKLTLRETLPYDACGRLVQLPHRPTPRPRH